MKTKIELNSNKLQVDEQLNETYKLSRFLRQQAYQPECPLCQQLTLDDQTNYCYSCKEYV